MDANTQNQLFENIEESTLIAIHLKGNPNPFDGTLNEMKQLTVVIQNEDGSIHRILKSEVAAVSILGDKYE